MRSSIKCSRLHEPNSKPMKAIFLALAVAVLASVASRAQILNTPATSGATYSPNSYVTLDGRYTPFSVSRSSANQTGTARRQVLIQQNARDIRVIWANYYRTNSTAIITNSNPIGIFASLEVNSAFYPIFFNGNRTNQIGAGAVVISDPIPISVSTSDSVWVRTYFDVGSGGFYPTGIPFYGSGSQGTDGMTFGSNLTESGTPTLVSSLSLYWSHLAVIGIPTGTFKPGVLLIGDSIMNGIDDQFNPNDSTCWRQPYGFASRALQSAGFGMTYLSAGSDTAAQWLSGGFIRMPAAAGTQVVLCNYGINDLSGGATYGTLQTNLKAIWTMFKQRGYKVFQTTLCPQTTSTDKWYTTGNQTKKSWETNRVNINAWLLDTSSSGAIAQSAGALSKVFDVASTVETNGLWKSQGTLVYSGTFTSATASNATDSNQSTLGLHVYDGQAVVITTGGTGSGQTVLLTANSPANVYSVSPNWSVTPDNTTTYQIRLIPTSDGVHPNRVEYQAMATAINSSVFTWP